MRRVAVACAGHIATCPRMLKAADAFVAAGYDVRVVSTVTTPALTDVDRRLHERRRWRWTAVPCGRTDAPVRWLVSGGRAKVARHVAGVLGDLAPYPVRARAYSRLHAELVHAILEEPVDVIYGGTNGAISAALEAAGIAGVPCGVDFEDFHCGELEPEGEGQRLNALAETVMADASRRAAFLTAGSAAIAAACADRFARAPLPIDNVFPLPQPPSFDRHKGPLRLYWFSQTIGEGRGLEDVVRAIGHASIPADLHLRGLAVPGYVERLRRCAAVVAPSLSITVHDRCDPDEMIASCAPFDAGISAEQGHIPNRALNLSNKALTYPLAGLALVLTETPGQRPLAETLNGHAIRYTPGDAAALGDSLRRWALDGSCLRQAREASWEAARTRWHWEHPLECEALLDVVAQLA